MSDIPNSFNPEQLKQLLSKRYGSLPRITYDRRHANELSYVMAMLLANQDGLGTNHSSALLLTANCLVLSVIQNLETNVNKLTRKARQADGEHYQFQSSDLRDLQQLSASAQQLANAERVISSLLEQFLEAEGATADGSVSQQFLDSLGLSAEDMAGILKDYTKEVGDRET